MNSQNFMKSTKDLEKNRLLTKKDFIAIIDRDPDLYKSIEYIRKWKIKDLRELYKNNITQLRKMKSWMKI